MGLKLAVSGTASMGKRIPQKDGGPRRPRHHSGKHTPQKDGGLRRPCHHSGKPSAMKQRVVVLAAAAAEDGKRQLAADDGERQLAAMTAELAAMAASRAKIENELAAERGKTAALQAEVHDLSSRVRHLSDLSQRQQLDIEWLTGLKRDSVSTPSRLMRRQQR